MALSTPSENQLPTPLNQAPSLVGSGRVLIKPKYKLDLAAEYGVHRCTIYEMCKLIGIVGGRKLSISQVVAFYNHYGYPGDYQVQLGLSNG